MSVSFAFDSPFGTNQKLGMFCLVWVGGFRIFGFPERLLWYDSFQVTISVVGYFFVERKVDMRFDKQF